MKKIPPIPQRHLPLVLVGMPGSGKSRIAREINKLTGIIAVDMDSEIKRRYRRDIPVIFREIGESGFRDLEYRTMRQVLEVTEGVVALGGGAVVRPESRELLRGYTVVYLKSDPDSIIGRIAGSEERPLLANDPKRALNELLQQRDDWYREVADYTIPRDEMDATEVAELIVRILRNPQSVNIEAGEVFQSREIQIPVSGVKEYQVHIGHGLIGEAVKALPENTRRVLLIHPQVLNKSAAHLGARLADTGIEVLDFIHPDGERAKTAEVAQRAWNVCGANRLTREDTVIGFGGGASTDLAGFIAATWLRGIECVQLPTTLLAMVDAAIGGKTGINTESGKNLVGAFWPPRAVFCDLDFLHTLSSEDLISGMAEVIKCGFIRDGEILELLSEGIPQIGSDALLDVVTRAVRVKAQVVSSDLRESGLREILNYGHTFGHALEKSSGFTLHHGYAVAIGMVYAAEVAEILQVAESGAADQHRSRIAKLGLPIDFNGYEWPQLHEAMLSDKKVRGGEIRMVLLSEPGKPGVVPITDVQVLAEAYRRVAAK